jgi:DEAD/DEAH box helicase
VRDYERFARSFTQIRAPDIRSQVEQIYAINRFWPEPLISINPHFEEGATVEQLARDGTQHQDTAHVFRVDGQPIRFHRHQAQAIAKAAQRQSFAVTTGTGSGKSLCFFVPIIDAAIRARAAGEAARTRAIVIYPMNALANSQLKELEKFIEQCELPVNLRPTFARYTGQESAEERDRSKQAKPDILLTNFMMLELLMTRQSTLDRAVIANPGVGGLDLAVMPYEPHHCMTCLAWPRAALPGGAFFFGRGWGLSTIRGSELAGVAETARAGWDVIVSSAFEAAAACWRAASKTYLVSASLSQLAPAC